MEEPKRVPSIDSGSDNDRGVWPHNRNLADAAKTLCGTVITLEGSIGVGKTTLCCNLVSEMTRLGLPACCHVEKVDEEHLRLFIDPATRKKFAFSFQLDTMLQRAVTVREAYGQAAKGSCVFLDRGLLGDRVFCLQQHAEGNIDDEQMRVYESRLKKELERNALVRREVGLYEEDETTVYVDAKPETAYARTMKRDNVNESVYTEDYFRALKAKHEEFFELYNRPPLLLDWDREYDLTSEGSAAEGSAEESVLPAEAVERCLTLLVGDRVATCAVDRDRLRAIAWIYRARVSARQQ